MRSLNKLTALLISLVIILGCLASCDNTAGTEDPEDLQTDNYVATVQIKLATDDNKMKAAVDAMSSSSVINVSGDNLSIHTVSDANETKLDNSYTLIDGILYHSLVINVGEYTVAETKKAEFTAENKDKLIYDVGAGASIGVEDFYNVEASKFGDAYTYVCSDAFDELKESLVDLVSSRFESIGATVYIDNVDYQLESLNGRSSSSVLSCSYVIAMDGESYEITMRLYTSYDYDSEPQISLPENSDSFTLVSYEEIVG